MKNNIHLFIIGFALASLLGLNSCSDFLDQVPDEKLNEEILFESRDDAGRVLSNAYTYQANILNIQGRVNPGKAGDEVDMIWSNMDFYKKDIGQYSPSSPIFNNWTGYYEGIRYSLYFLNHIDECKDPKLSEEEREWWKGEANFLIAYYYFNLFTSYGPVPIIDKVYQASEIESVIAKGVERPSVNRMVEFIDSILVKEAIPKLDVYYTKSGSDRAGRASKVAAAHLRSRLHLYAASPLYNGMHNPTTGKDYTYLSPLGLSGNPLLNTEYDANKWELALDAAKEAIDWTLEGDVKLYQESGQNGYNAYSKLFNWSRKGVPVVETIFYRQNEGSQGFNGMALPVSWATFSGVCPTLEHVNEYFMANGVMPEDDSEYKRIPDYKTAETYEAAGKQFSVPKKFTKRDPRFYVNILFPGQYSYAVVGTNDQGEPIESTSTRWAYNTTSNFTDYIWYRPWYDGADGYLAHTGRDFTINGFLFIKYVGREDNITSRGDYQIMQYRLGETYLNYIESAFEFCVSQGRNPLVDEEIFKYWDMLRDRVQLPRVRVAYEKAGIPLTVDKLRALIHRERRIELAMEGHRYYDNRRWLDAEREGGAKHGFNIFNKETNFWDEEYEFEKRIWNDKMYFLPMNQTEIDKNWALTQNYGW